MNDFEGFIDQLIKDKNLDSESPDVLAQIKKDLIDSLERRVNSLIVTSLDSDKLADFESVLDTDNQEDIDKFVRENISDIDERVAAELLEFRTLYIS